MLALGYYLSPLQGFGLNSLWHRDGHYFPVMLSGRRQRQTLVRPSTRFSPWYSHFPTKRRSFAACRPRSWRESAFYDLTLRFFARNQRSIVELSHFSAVNGVRWRKTVFSRGERRFLAENGVFSRRMTISRGEWRFLAENGVFSRRMVFFRGEWRFLAENGVFWRRMMISRGEWRFLAENGVRWRRMSWLRRTFPFSRTPWRRAIVKIDFPTGPGFLTALGAAESRRRGVFAHIK